ncbi:hypothetical protein [Viridibacillus arvi]|uniref:hypothetical protein n=1 Tax=Viridibacillus arvi TaxID=263475 RepID=UPI003CFF8653
MMISFILFYLIGIPISVLLHEIGHALGVVLFSNEETHVYLGSKNDSNNENFQLGRIHFHINWAYFGFCAVNKNKLTKLQFTLMSIGGPIVSLILFSASYFLMVGLSHFEPKNFFKGMTIINFVLFISTIIPIRYPNWIKPYAGLSSDGYQILKLFKDDNSK